MKVCEHDYDFVLKTADRLKYLEDRDQMDLL